MEPENKKDIQPNQSKKEPELTEQNWLMLKYLREGKRVREAYTLAGYKGTGEACYHLYQTIKGKLREIVEADGFNKTRLAIEMDKILSLPLDLSKTEVTLSEKLKSIRLANQILTEDAQKNPQATFTMIVIQNEPMGTKGPQGVNGDIVDVVPLDEGGEVKG